MNRKAEKHCKEVMALEDNFGFGWALIKYPVNQNEEAVYSCNAGHLFEMAPKTFSKRKTNPCPICEIDREINRNSPAYKVFLRQAKETNQGKCELTGDRNIAVHHLYSIRKFPELSYNTKNTVSLNKNLHKEYHRHFSPYNTNSYTFLAWLHWLRDIKKPADITTDSINRLICRVEDIMEELEKEIKQKRSNTTITRPSGGIIQRSIINLQELDNMFDKADDIIQDVEIGKTVELANGEVIIYSLHIEPIIFYKNDYGNWLEYNRISGSILENVYKIIISS